MSVNANEANPTGTPAPGPPPIRVYDIDDNKLEILRIGYENQLQYLRLMSNLDVKVFTGYITVQLVVANWVANWVAQIPPPSIHVKWGLFVVDIAFTALAIAVLYNNQKRRDHAVAVLKNLSEALGFTAEGVFLPDNRALHPGKEIEDKVPLRPWIWIYYLGCIVSVVGIGLIIFGS